MIQTFRDTRASRARRQKTDAIALVILLAVVGLGGIVLLAVLSH